MSTEPGGTRVQVGAVTLRVSAAVFSAYFHSPCGCFDAFAAPEAVCVCGGVLPCVPVQPHAEVKSKPERDSDTRVGRA